MADNDKKDEFNQERMFGRVAKIPIFNTVNELVEMDFADYGNHAAFLRIQDTFSRFSVIIFRRREKEEQTAEAVKASVISESMAFFGTPEITTVDKDSRFVGGIFQDSCTARNVILQTAIPGHHQSLGATERRLGLFRTIIDHVTGGRKHKKLNNKEWKEFSPMTMMHLNSQVRQYGGFTPGQRVFGRTPKLPIGTIDNPFFWDFTNPADAPTTET